VFDSLSKKPLKNTVASFVADRDSSVIDGDDNGQLYKQLYPAAQYKVTVSDSGYYSTEVVVSSNFSKKEMDTIVQNVYLEPGGKRVYVDLKVTDDKSKPLAGVNVVLRSRNDYKNTSADKKGHLFAPLYYGETYTMEVSKMEYGTKYVTLSPRRTKKLADTIFKTVALEPTKGDTVDIVVIPFAFDKYTLDDTAKERLGVLLEYLKVQNPKIKIQLRAHTDCRGGYDYNMTLSNNRARSVRQYLIENHIASNRIECVGVGYNEPKFICSNCETPRSRLSDAPKTDIDPNGKQCSEEEQYQNRALDFIKMKPPKK
jgi:outer membrane protein OmpA-like peptidoglycan-associated protein